MNAQLQLLFHADHLTFALIREFDDWRLEFNRLREALNFAKNEGATELPFLVLDDGELFSECIIGVEPMNRGSQITTPELLAAVIQRTLNMRATCRVYPDMLNRCWDVPSSRMAEHLEEFARARGWAVKIHQPATYGVVADFTIRMDS
jgi:hypothetical protein